MTAFSEAEGRQKGEPRSGVGESFHPVPGGCREATGGSDELAPHEKSRPFKPAFVWSIGHIENRLPMPFYWGSSRKMVLIWY